MSTSERLSHTTFVLPPGVVGKRDVSRLISDAERVDNELTSAAVRAKAGATQLDTTVVSDELTDFLQRNDLTFGDNSRERTELIKQLRLLKDHAPVIHMTFAVTADRDSLQQLADWVRTTVHPQALIAVGLQPALVAGVYVRTPNHVHDFSLRAKLDGQHDVLVKELEALRGSN